MELLLASTLPLRAALHLAIPALYLAAAHDDADV